MGFIWKLSLTAVPALLLALFVGSCGDDGASSGTTDVDFTLRCATGSCGGCDHELLILPEGGSIALQVRSAEVNTPVVAPECRPIDEPFPLGQISEKLSMLALSPLPAEELLLFEVFVSDDTFDNCPPESFKASATSTSIRLSEQSGPVEMVVTCY